MVLVVEIKSGTIAAVSPDGTVDARRHDRAAVRTARPSGPTGSSTCATTAASSGTTSNGHDGARRAAGRLHRRAHPARRHRPPVRSRTSTPSATASGCAGRTTSSSTPTAGSGSPTSARRARGRRDKGGLYYATGRRVVDHRGGLPADDAERRRPVARRATAVRRRDDDRAAVRLGRRPRPASWPTPAARPGRPCCTTSPASSCSTRWPSTATATSAWPRLITGAITVISPSGDLLGRCTRCRSTTCSSPTSASAAPTTAPRSSPRRATACCTRCRGRTPAWHCSTRSEQGHRAGSPSSGRPPPGRDRRRCVDRAVERRLGVVGPR